jgi:hypothetical protein
MDKEKTRNLAVALCIVGLLSGFAVFVTGCATGSQEPATTSQSGEMQQKPQQSSG